MGIRFQIIPCGRLDLLSESLREVRAESTVCVLSCVTNFITASSGSTTSPSQRVEPVLLQLLSCLEVSAKAHEDRLFLVAPPMYRTFPEWYRDGLPEILKKFSSTMMTELKNIRLLPSFATPMFEQDGVHLTPYSGLEFVLHLFDSASALMDSFTSQPEEVLISNCESSRVLEDRMMAIEQDHRRLNRVFEDKIAIDAELAEFQENIRYEAHFVIAGLSRIPKCDTRQWQEKAKRDVSGVVSLVIGRDVKILFVRNITSKNKDAVIRYEVQTESVAVSKEIRDKFSAFFANGKDIRPTSLKKISLHNRLTHESRVRFNIMKILGQHYLSSNKGAVVRAIRFESRPMLKIIPPEGSSDPRVRTMNYIEAVRTLPATFSPDELQDILSQIKPKWYGRVKPLFIILSDDMINKSRLSKGAPRGANARNTNKSDDSPPEADGSGSSSSNSSRPSLKRPPSPLKETSSSKSKSKSRNKN